MYADDTQLTHIREQQYSQYSAKKSLSENVHNWLRANKLTLNVTKTEFMSIGSRQRLSTVIVSPTVAIYDFQVTQVATAKSLGVTINDNLDWGSHMEKITTSIFWHRGHKASKAPCAPSLQP